MTRDEAIERVEAKLAELDNPHYAGRWPWERTLLLLQVGVPIFEVRQKVVDGHYMAMNDVPLKQEWLEVAKIVGRVTE